MEGWKRYQAALGEIHRILRPGGVFGLGEPMHLEVPIPEDLRSYVTKGEFCWADCFSDLSGTVARPQASVTRAANPAGSGAPVRLR
ncbi:hypothetical protein [Streptomyces sp. WG-D5]